MECESGGLAWGKPGRQESQGVSWKEGLGETQGSGFHPEAYPPFPQSQIS